MEGFHLKNFEVKTSKSGHSVPVVNDVHLHSVYDPIKEAVAFVDRYKETLKYNNKVLIFGLGFGYHIEIIIKLMKRYHKSYEIFVIEPVQKVFKGCQRLKRIRDENISIYAGHDIKSLYSDFNLVDFLSKKPVIVAHPASMNIHSNYFKSFMTFDASPKIKDIAQGVYSTEIKEGLGLLEDSETNYDEYIELLKNKKNNLHKADYLVLALEEIAK